MRQFVDINLSVPEEILLSLRVGSEEFSEQIKLMVALKLCETQKLSIGQSASFAGMAEEDFIKFMSRNKVSIFGSAADIAQDYQNA